MSGLDEIYLEKECNGDLVRWCDFPSDADWEPGAGFSNRWKKYLSVDLYAKKADYIDAKLKEAYAEISLWEAQYKALERKYNQLKHKIAFERDNNLVDYSKLEDR